MGMFNIVTLEAVHSYIMGMLNNVTLKCHTYIEHGNVQHRDT